MEREARFKIAYMQDAIDFLTLLPQKARVKVVYNIGKSMFVLDNSLFKKLGNTDIWEFRTLYDGMAYRLFAFGIQMQRHWLLLRMALQRKRKRRL